MTSIEELIEDHHESNYLDFKLEDYPKEKKHELLKDLVAFANSDYSGPRYIIIGVNEKTDPRELVDIAPRLDSAALQEYVESNINPELSVDMFPFPYANRKLLVIRINAPENQPYEIKKVQYISENKTWAEGTMFIRVGSKTKSMSRKYLDKIYQNKFAQEDTFENKVFLKFKESNSGTLSLNAISRFDLPSKKAEHTLEEIIKEKMKYEEVKNSGREKNIFPTYNKYREIWSKNFREISEQLAGIPKNYAGMDKFFISEKYANKIQLIAENISSKHLKNVTLIINTNREYRDMYIAENRPIEYHDTPFLYTVAATSYKPHVNYPRVKSEGYLFQITQKLIEIPHNLDTDIFETPLRVTFLEKAKGEKIELNCELHAENIGKPLCFKLFIDVT